MLSLKQYYLEKLAEECAEVAQRALKQSQFGAEEIQKNQPLTNRERLDFEINDLLLVVGVLQRMGEISIETTEQVIAHNTAKGEKIEKYLKYSQSLGMVEK